MKILMTIIAILGAIVLGIVIKREMDIKKLFKIHPNMPRIRQCNKCGAVQNLFTYTTSIATSKIYWERMYSEEADKNDPNRECVCNKHADI